MMRIVGWLGHWFGTGNVRMYSRRRT